MTVEIHLLGSPRVVRDGTVMQAPRGFKAWGLLAYLLLREVPAGRAHVAELLFPAADDPLAALRWNLSEVRRLVGDPGAFRGDPLSWADAPAVDVLALRSTTGTAAYEDLDQDLLGSMAFPDCPSFEIWLEAERRRARGAVESLLHETALARLARGDADSAADLAARLVARNPYDENCQVLLVRALATGGRGIDAARQAAACRELFRTELGVEPGPALDAAMITSTARTTTSAVTGPPAVRALIRAGEAAIGAGALEAGLECLRRAVDDATTLADGPLTARSLTVLGTALVHAARGSDEEGATALHRALAHADPETLAQALNELGYIEFLHARYDRVETWLERIDTADPGLRAAALSVRGSVLSDQARYPEAHAALADAVDLAQDDRRRCFAVSMIGRIHLLHGDLDEAATVLDEAVDLAVGDGWSAFLPWPEALRAEVDLLRGDVRAAQSRLDHAFALGCQLGDPCWEGLSARGLGLLRNVRGDVDGAVESLLDARRRAARLPDAYVWVQAYVLDALAAVGVERGLPPALSWANDLAALAGRAGMVELGARAALHRAALGDPAGRDAAHALAAGIANPALRRLLTSG